MSLEQWQGRSALVVDDSRTQQYEVTCLLQDLGFGQIHLACDGQDALNKLQQLEHVDLLLTDLNMPGMDGVELISQLEKHTGYQMFVAVMSAVDRDVLDVIHSIADAGTLEVIGVLAKPLRAQDLRNMLQHCDPRVHRENNKWMQLTFTSDDVRHALEQGQLVPFLQPKITMSDASLYGFEALVRWHHPEHGTLPPVCFVHHLEEGPLALDFFYAFLHATCEALNKLTLQTGQLSCSINLPVSLLTTDKLVETMVEVVQGHSPALSGDYHRSHRDHLHVQPRRVARYPRPPATAWLRCGNGRLRHRLLLDETALPLPVYRNQDRQGVCPRCPYQPQEAGYPHLRHCDEPKTGAQRPSLKGVESEEDWDQLALLGCDLAQGYYISRPLPVEQIAHWFGEWQAKNAIYPEDQP